MSSQSHRPPPRFTTSGELTSREPTEIFRPWPRPKPQPATPTEAVEPPPRDPTRAFEPRRPPPPPAPRPSEEVTEHVPRALLPSEEPTEDVPRALLNVDRWLEGPGARAAVSETDAKPPLPQSTSSTAEGTPRAPATDEPEYTEIIARASLPMLLRSQPREPSEEPVEATELTPRASLSLAGLGHEDSRGDSEATEETPRASLPVGTASFASSMRAPEPTGSTEVTPRQDPRGADPGSYTLGLVAGAVLGPLAVLASLALGRAATRAGALHGMFGQLILAVVAYVSFAG